MSRFDNEGLFWVDIPRENVKHGGGSKGPKVERVRPIPPIPDTGWCMPSEFPSLASARIIAFDTETFDGGIQAGEGPGFPKGNAHVVGVSVGTDDGYRGYFPVRHTVGNNFDPKLVFKWLARELGRESQLKIGHNVIYDLEGLSYEGVQVRGKIYDTMLAEALIDENKFSYSLDSTGRKYVGEGKVDNLLYEWSAQAYGGKADRSQANNIYRCPSQLVGPYAEGDVDLPLRIFEKQEGLLRADGLWDLFEMECELLPLLVTMRRRGVRVDAEKAERVRDDLLRRIERDEEQLAGIAGRAVNVYAAADLAVLFDRMGVKYPETAAGNPSFTKAWLEKGGTVAHNLVNNIRRWKKFQGTFLDGYIINAHHEGRVYGQFHQTKSDEGGTISGRLSSSCPNLENIPARDEELGPAIRSMFLPDEDEEWISADYSQIEFRLLVHYGRGPSADEARRKYFESVKTDFHDLVAQMTGLARKRAKGINFGKAYGMGVGTAAESIGCSEREAREFIAQYDRELPFVGELLDAVGTEAQNRGWIRTILGRRARFELWESKDWSDKSPAMTYEKALEKWGVYKIRRAKTHAALNRLIQGGAADLFKMALVKILRAGITTVLGAPLNLVHDEICWSRPRTKAGAEAINEMAHIMRTAIPLTVPVLVDVERGPNWGELEDWNE